MLKWLRKGLLGEPKLPKNYKDFIDPEAIEIVQRLQRGGFETYLVGGCVRDILLGKKPKDFDIATKASPQQAKSHVRRSFLIGRRFRIVIAKRSVKSSEIDSDQNEFPVVLQRTLEKEFEITTFRRDPVIVNGVVNENVFGSCKEDALRRDFTVNALYLDPIRGDIVDHTDGLKDIKTGTLRMIGNPEHRFQEDPIRILRCLRFQRKGNLKLHSDTASALEKQSHHLSVAKKERIREEILKAFREGTCEDFFHDLDRLKLWPHISPSLSSWLHGNPERKKQLYRLSAQLKAEPWKNPHVSTPLFFLMLEGLWLESSTQVSPELPIVCEDLKVSRQEKEGMERIWGALRRIQRDPEAKHPNKILAKNHKSALTQIETFYVLKNLAKAGVAPWNRIWTAWSPAWQEHLPYLRSVSRTENKARQFRDRERERGRKDFPDRRPGPL